MELIRPLPGKTWILNGNSFDEIPLFDGTEPAGLPIIEPPKRTDDLGDITLQIGHSQPEVLNVPRYYMSDTGLNLQDIHIKDIDAANAAMKNIDVAIEAVADIRAGFGASQSHLEHTYQNLSVTNENMTSAESRIRDTDMADEFTSLTRENVMFQAGASMCAQANSLPEMVMNLLR